MALNFPQPALIEFNNNPLTDHGRAPLDVRVERITVSQRLANGVRRQFFVADKHHFSLSWSDLPVDDADTVDGNWGVESMENFYLNNIGNTVTLKFHNKDGTTDEYTVYIDNFEKTVVQRVGPHRYDVSMEVVEK